jgi:hypothetical protein
MSITFKCKNCGKINYVTTYDSQYMFCNIKCYNEYKNKNYNKQAYNGSINFVEKKGWQK